MTALLDEYSQWAFDEERAPGFRGQWRKTVFEAADKAPLDLEIGTGNGLHFSHRALQVPERNIVGLEIKFKPLIQSIRRARNGGAVNARMVRYHARLVNDLFAEGELNNVYIHHPDPWTKRSKHKHRLMQVDFLHTLYKLQRPGSFVDFKTDSHEYFLWALREIKASPYTLERCTEDLHQSQWAGENFITQFERLFIQQGIRINYARLYLNPEL